MLDIVGMTDDAIGASNLQTIVVLRPAGARSAEQHRARRSENQSSYCRSAGKDHGFFER